MDDAMPPEPAPDPAPALKTVEQWAAEKRTQGWLFAAAKSLGAWGIGRELSESAYDAVVHRAAHVAIR